MENLRTKEIKIGTIQAWLDNDTAVANKIIEKYSDINTDYEWYDFTYETFVKTAAKVGFELNLSDIQFSGFSSQGDGASFTGSIDVLGYLTVTRQLTKFKYLRKSIINGDINDMLEIERGHSNYSHENTCSVEEFNVFGYDDMSDKALNQTTEFEEHIEDIRHTMSLNLYKMLENTYNELTSRECIIETLAANEYEFNEYLEMV